MTCPPSPGVLGYLACALALLAAHPLQVLAFALSALAALGALVLARRRPDHEALLALPVIWAADAARWLLAPALLAGGPYAGWLRVVQHLDTALFLIWPASLLWLVMLSFIVPQEERAEARKLIPLMAAGTWIPVALAAVVAYPELRGDALGRYLAMLQTGGLVGSLLGAVRARAGRGWPEYTTPRAVASLVVALELLSLVAGPWWRGLFGAAYLAEESILCVLYGAILAVEVRALRMPLTNPLP